MDVGEIKVESEQNARVCPAPLCNFGIVRPRESFVVDGLALPTGRPQDLGGLYGQILIELRAHTRKLRRKRKDSLLRQGGRICQGRVNGRARQRGIAPENFLGGQAVCQVRQDHGDRNSCATNARLAVENRRIDGDVFAPLHVAILINECGLAGTGCLGGRDV